ncbi:5-hydroxyisourate hydrolase [Thiomonas sp. X19]|uniref:hydroxyisourate hydrolase n=1 Tax=Thiomonas sp. X19 TaxID=1050370 RepID=UPI000B6F8943|nr:hydroxyisourate hydrolase [Thiomonas sp. X19]SCC92284.1 5-hydroxyisourate hydrolase [Thiomonas sp. X19]
MGKLTTHILDTARGKPAAGVHITVLAERSGAWVQLSTAITNADGRCDAPLLQDAAFAAGRYRLVFHVGPYFEAQGLATAFPAFLEDVPIEFGAADAAGHYHVPLLVTPWSYATYRGS